LKVLLVSSNGGHFWQLLKIMECFDQDDVCVVTFRTPDVESSLGSYPCKTYWGYHPTNRNLRNLIRNSFLAIRVIREFHPDLIVTTGAGIGVPFLVLGKILFRKKTMFIEVFDRVRSASLTGRLVAPFSDWVILQAQVQRTFYPKGIVLGGLLWSSSRWVHTDSPWNESFTGP